MDAKSPATLTSKIVDFWRRGKAGETRFGIIEERSEDWEDGLKVDTRALLRKRRW